MSSSEINVTPFSATDPAKAAITSVGGASAGGTASSSKPTITGTGEPGQVVNLYDGVRWLGSTTVASDGTWSITAATTLKVGKHSFTAICVGADGVNGLSSEPVSVTVPADSSNIPPTPAIGGVIDNVGPVKGNVASGGSTDDPKPTFTGSGANPGDIITIKDGSTPIGSAIVKPDGTWSVKPDAELGNGPHTITAVEKNPSTGATSTPSPATTINVDTTVPSAPSNVHVTDPSTGGNVPSGGTTGSPSPVISGSGKPGDIVTVTDNGTPIGSTVVDGNGNWSITPNPPLVDGPHNIAAIETNPNTGATSAPSPGTPISVDSLTPPTPAIGTITDHVGPVQKPLVNGDTTDDSQPTFSGNHARPGDIITVSDKGTPIGSAVVGADGSWSVTPATPLGNGSHTITATEKNPTTGATSPASPAVVISVDTTVPTTPAIGSIIDHVGPVQRPLVDGDTTDDTKPTFTGDAHSAKPGDVITISDHGVPIGSATVNPDGSWSVTPTAPLDNGSHVITATETNPATGATSLPTPGITLGVDTTTPAAPVISIIDHVGAVTGVVPNGGTTDDLQPTVTGSGAKAGDIITVTDGGKVIGSTTVNTDGTWAFTPTDLLVNGSHAIAAIETNAAGVSSGSSAPVTINVALGASGTGGANAFWISTVGVDKTFVGTGQESSSHDALISYQLSSSGYVKDYSLVTIYDNNVVIGTVMAGSNGQWFFAPDYLAKGDHHLVVKAIPYGKTIPEFSGMQWFTVTAPDTPVPEALTPFRLTNSDNVGLNHGQGIIDMNGLGTTDDQTPTFYGAAPAGNRVTMWVDGKPVGEAWTIDGWSVTPATPLAYGSHIIQFTATNQAGKTSLPTKPFEVMIAPDYQTPNVALAAPDGSGFKIGDVISTHTPVFSDGGGVRGSKVTIYDNNIVIGTTIVDIHGNWSFKPAYMNSGAHHIRVQATNLGMSTAGMSTDHYFTIDTTGTIPPAIAPLPIDLDAAAALNMSLPKLAMVDDTHTFAQAVDVPHPQSVAIEHDPAAYFQQPDTHVQGSHSGQDTIALTGDHQILDLTALSGKTAAAKISGVEVFDLGGHQNTLKVSLLDVLNLGEQDLFIHDGKQQVVVKGAAGDAVDLSNTHVAGVADGQWAQHGTAQVGGVTYAVFEHSGAHVELLVQQGVATTVHQ